MTFDLIAVVTAASSVVLAFLTWLYLRQLNAGYAHSIEPHLHWQNPRRAANPQGANIAEFSIVVTNVGLGAARLTKATVSANTGAELTIRDLRTPSTLPSGAAYTFFIPYTNFTAAFIANADIHLTIALEYTDVEHRRCYRSEVTINGKQDLHGAAEGPIDFVTLDERPARDRRVDCRRNAP